MTDLFTARKYHKILEAIVKLKSKVILGKKLLNNEKELLVYLLDNYKYSFMERFE